MAMTLKQYLLIVVATLSFVLMPVAASAQTASLTCNTSNGAIGSGQFYDSSNAGFCQYQGITHIFSQIVCNFVGILNSVVGTMYCGIQYSLTPILAVLLSIYIAIFGAQILMGMAQLNAKEIIIRMLKIAGVWTFATQSTWGVSLIFQFFFSAASEGSMWVINSINSSNNTVPYDSSGNFMPMYAYLDTLIYNAILGPFTAANSKVIGFFIILMFFFPPLFFMACDWAKNTVIMLANTLVNSLLCLSAIAFLIALSPLFLSFMLFQTTVNFFEDWLKFLISYTLQIVIVFAIISLWIAAMALFGGFFTQLSNLIYPYQHVDVDIVFSPDDTYGICQYNTFYSPPGSPGQPCTSALPCFPTLICNPQVIPNNGNVIPPSQLEFDENFVFFMAYNLTALSIIAHMFGVLIKEAPKLAVQLSGPANVPQFGGGFGMRGLGQLGGGGRTPPAGTGNAARDFFDSAVGMVTGRKKPPGK